MREKCTKSLSILFNRVHKGVPKYKTHYHKPLHHKVYSHLLNK